MKNFEIEAVSWPVNLEVVTSGVNIPIVDGNLNETYFQGEESHIFFINLYKSNKSSFQVEDVSFKLFKIFQRSVFKYKIILENSDHSYYNIKENVNIQIYKVRFQRWWKLTFKT